MRGHAYSPAELSWLKRHRASAPMSVVGPRFRARFGLNITDKALAMFCKRHGIHAGTDGCFVRGHTPWNLGASVRVSQRTEFRPGNRPSNMRVVGEYRQVDGRWLLKVRETGAKGHSRHDWETVSRLTWSAHHGPVPKGHVVMVLDKDEDACLDIDNLACVSRAVLARANQDGYAELPPDRALRRAALAAAALRQAVWDAARSAGLSLYERRRLLSQGAAATVRGG